MEAVLDAVGASHCARLAMGASDDDLARRWSEVPGVLAARGCAPSAPIWCGGRCAPRRRWREAEHASLAPARAVGEPEPPGAWVLVHRSARALHAALGAARSAPGRASRCTAIEQRAAARQHDLAHLLTLARASVDPRGNEAHLVRSLDEATALVRETLSPQAPPRAEVDVLDVLSRAARTAQAARRSGARRVDIMSATPIPPAPTSPASLERLLRNLILNGLEASHPEAAVTVHIVSGSEEIRIEIADTGRGLPEGPSPGLGLASVRACAADAGATIDVVTSVGSGTIWTVRLPARRSHEIVLDPLAGPASATVIELPGATRIRLRRGATPPGLASWLAELATRGLAVELVGERG